MGVSVAVYLGNGILTSAKKILSYRHPVVHKIEPNHAPGSGDNMTVVRISVSEIGEIRGQHQNHIAGVDEEHKAMIKKIKRSVSIGGKPQDCQRYRFYYQLH